MGQKTNPIGNRLGIIRGWDSSWFGNKRTYAPNLLEDTNIRKLELFLKKIEKDGIMNIDRKEK